VGEKSLKELIEEQFATDCSKLPVFSGVALELQKLKNSETVTTQQVADVVMKDQTLTSRILQVANSSFYGGLKKVDTLSAAILRLGFKRMASLALVASQSLAHKTSNAIIATYMPKLWCHSYASAMGARWLAENCGYKSYAEQAFLGGLLHDIGELFLIKVLEDLHSQNHLKLSEELIKEILDTLHNEMGYRVMLNYELPETYALIARDHHLEQCDENDTLMALIRLIDIICHKLGIGINEEPNEGIILAATTEAQILGINDIKLAQLEVQIEDIVLEAKSLMS
jgi:HD-like signal output (HDOD) protein